MHTTKEFLVAPATRRPGALPRCLRFNQTVGVDLVEFDTSVFKKILMNVACGGAGYQMCCVIPDKTSESVRDAFSEHWIRHYSWPELLITDQGPEFVGHEFTTYIAQGGCLQHFIDSQSPWQQGRTGRAGGSLKEDLRDICEEAAIITDRDFDIALTGALDARSRFNNRSGYSAHQRVFGSNLRLPGCLQSDDPCGPFRRARRPNYRVCQNL